jgi:hypothetical protein
VKYQYACSLALKCKSALHLLPNRVTCLWLSHLQGAGNRSSELNNHPQIPTGWARQRLSVAAALPWLRGSRVPRVSISCCRSKWRCFEGNPVQVAPWQVLWQRSVMYRQAGGRAGQQWQRAFAMQHVVRTGGQEHWNIGVH